VNKRDNALGSSSSSTIFRFFVLVNITDLFVYYVNEE